MNVVDENKANELRAMWKSNGGMIHGPNIETGSMPETLLLPLLEELINLRAAAERVKLQKPAVFVNGRKVYFNPDYSGRVEGEFYADRMIIDGFHILMDGNEIGQEQAKTLFRKIWENGFNASKYEDISYCERFELRS